MTLLSLTVIVLAIIIQVSTKSKKILFFIPTFFSSLFIIVIFLNTDFGTIQGQFKKAQTLI